MATENINIEVKAQLEDFQRKMDEMQAKLKGSAKTADESTSKIGGAFGKLDNLMAGYLSLSALSSFTKKLVSVRGDMQQLEIAFSTMLGSAEKADEMISQLTDTAARTPFDMSGLANGAKQLLAYGTASEEVNDTLVRLGNIASGLSIPLNDLVYLYGTTQTQGRLFTQDVRQFMGRGIPLVKELAAELGKTEEQINAMVSAGDIGFDDVKKVIERMTDEGGQFFQLMEKQSDSLTGKVSNLGDSIDSMFNDIGEALQEPIGNAVEMATTLAENYKTVLRVISPLVAAYGAYNAAVKINLALQSGGAIRNVLDTLNRMRSATTAAAKAQIAFNAVCAANPYVLLAAAIVGVCTALAVFNSDSAKQEKSLKRVEEQTAGAADATKQYATELKSLADTIDDVSKAEWERVYAFKELQKSGVGKGMSFPQWSGMSDMDKEIALAKAESDKEIAELEKAIDAFRAKRKDELDNSWVSTENYWDYSAEDYISDLQNVWDKQTEAYERGQKKIQQIREKYKVKQEVQSDRKDKAYWEKLKKDNEAKRAQLTTDELGGQQSAKYAENIRLAEKMLALYDLAEKTASKNADAQKEYNNALAEYQTLLSNLSERSLGEFAGREQEAIERHAENLKRLEEMQALGVDTTEGRKQNDDNLQDQLAKVAEDREEEIRLMNERLNEGLQSEFEKRIQSINDAYDKLAKDIKDKFKDDPALNNLLSKVEKARKSDIGNATSDNELSMAEADAQIKRIDAQTDLNNGIITEKQYKRQLYDIEGALLSAELDKAQQVHKQLNDQESLLKLKKAQAEVNLHNSQDPDKNGNGDGNGNGNGGADKIEMIRIGAEGLSDAFGKVADSIEKLGGNSTAAGVFKGLSEGLADASALAGSLFSAFDDIDKNGEISPMSKMQLGQSALQATLNIVSTITDQIAENRRQQELWNQAMLDSAHRASMIKIENAEYESPNIWGGDSYENKLKGLMEKKDVAMKEMDGALDTLEKEGQVQVGTKTVMGWQNAAKCALEGAVAGAAIGTMIEPGIGTGIAAAAGAIGGFITGLFAGKQKIPIYKKLTEEYGELFNEKTMELNEKMLADYDKMDDKTKKLLDNAKEIVEKAKEAKEEYEDTVAEMTDDIYKNMSDALVKAFTSGDVYGAVEDFRKFLSKSIGNIMSNAIFDAYYGKRIKQLSDAITNSETTDSKVISDQIAETLSYVDDPARLNSFRASMQDMQRQFEDFDLWMADEADSQEALKGTIAGMSEETAGKINGNFMGLKLTAMEINTSVASITASIETSRRVMDQSLTVQREIADNTNYCRNLEAIRGDIAAMRRDGVRAL